MQYGLTDDIGSKAVIIIGMHRSGTSLITNWLHKCGLHIGDELLAGATGNIEGHFEDIDFYSAHVDILKENGLPESGMIINGDCPITITPGSFHQLFSLINRKKSKHKIWGWKDPRTCLLLDTYRKLLPEAFQLIIIRDYQSVVVSLLKRSFADEIEKPKKRTGFSGLLWTLIKRRYKFRRFCFANAEFFLQVWIHYNKKILEHICEDADRRPLVIDYTMLKTNDAEVTSFLNSNWGLDLRHFDFAKVYKEGLMSSKLSLDDFLKDKELKRRADDLQQQLTHYIGIPNLLIN